jgi:hypothetical protein
MRWKLTSRLGQIPTDEQALRRLLDHYNISKQSLESITDGSSSYIFDTTEAQRRIREFRSQRRQSLLGVLAMVSALASVVSAFTAYRSAYGFVGSGWYLITPPVGGNSSEDIAVQMRAPFSRWDIVGSYDTAAECRPILSQNAKATGAPDWMSQASDIEKRALKESVLDARCVATDDPRLREP